MAIQEGGGSKVKKEDVFENDVLPMHGVESEQVPNDSSENCSISSGLSPKVEQFKVSSCSEDVESGKICETATNNKDLGAKSTSCKTSKSKRRRSHSESDSTDIDSIPSLRSRLSKKNILKKPKTVSGEETAGNRKETDSIVERIGDDNDFESPKARKNTAKRKGSDLSDDQDLYTSVFSTSSETAPSSTRDARKG